MLKTSSWRVRKRDIIYYFYYVIALIILLNVDYTNDITILFLSNTMLKIGVTFVTLIIITIRHIKLYSTTKLLLLGYVIILISSIINGRSLNDAIHDMISVVGMMLLFNCGFEIRKTKFIELMKVLLIALSIINFVSILLYPDGIYFRSGYYANWVWGYKNVHIRYLIPACVLLINGRLKDNEKLGVVDYIALVFTLLSSVMVKSSTAIGGALIFALLVITENLRSKGVQRFIKFFINPLTITIGIAVLYYVVLWGDSAFLGGVLQKYFGRDLTFTGRVYIWTKCIDLIKTHLLFGMGYLNNVEFYSLINIGIGAHPHNYFIGILFYGGIISFVMFFMAYIRTFKNYRANKNNAAANICLWAILSFLVMGISDVMLFAPFIHTLLIIYEYYCRYEKTERE